MRRRRLRRLPLLLSAARRYVNRSGSVSVTCCELHFYVTFFKRNSATNELSLVTSINACGFRCPLPRVQPSMHIDNSCTLLNVKKRYRFKKATLYEREVIQKQKFFIRRQKLPYSYGWETIDHALFLADFGGFWGLLTP
jgi:hypothetical protein